MPVRALPEPPLASPTLPVVLLIFQKIYIIILAKMILEFSVHLGETTSLDITKNGIDKAYGLKKLSDLLNISIQEMIFVGDALFINGNDYPVKEAGGFSIKVRDTIETKRIIKTIIACFDFGSVTNLTYL
jgi:hydroxymethylpyrimidine pyrophosphatase-like HAD family hydrolase